LFGNDKFLREVFFILSLNKETKVLSVKGTFSLIKSTQFLSSSFISELTHQNIFLGHDHIVLKPYFFLGFDIFKSKVRFISLQKFTKDM
jgi:hypothetical protein